MFTKEQQKLIVMAYGKAALQKMNIIAKAIQFAGKNNAPVFTMNAISNNEPKNIQTLWAVHLRSMQYAGLIRKRTRGVYEVTPLGMFWYNSILDYLNEYYLINQNLSEKTIPQNENKPAETNAAS